MGAILHRISAPEKPKVIKGLVLGAPAKGMDLCYDVGGARG
jgi:hypothetical protein